MTGSPGSAESPVGGAPAHRVPVLYVGGIGRSGSTVLGRVLATLPGVHSVGEVVHLWGRGLARGDRCGCGCPFRECPFWSEVGRRAFGGWEQVDARELLRLQEAVDRNRHLPWIVAGTGPAAFSAALRDYVDVLGRLYVAMREASGADVLVDTSKNAPYAWLLRRVPEVDLRVLHLVRDSHGVAHSWAKKGLARPEVVDGTAYMATVPVARLAARWTGANALFDLLARTSTPGMRLRYEDFVDDPDGTVRRVGAFLGRSGGPAQRLAPDEPLQLPREHEVSGNPLRFEDRAVRLRRDEQWRTDMPVGDRRLVTALTAPGLWRYGYPPLGRTPAARLPG